jgi:hypothetical protein
MLNWAVKAIQSLAVGHCGLYALRMRCVIVERSPVTQYAMGQHVASANVHVTLCLHVPNNGIQYAREHDRATHIRLAIRCMGSAPMSLTSAQSLRTISYPYFLHACNGQVRHSSMVITKCNDDVCTIITSSQCHKGL